MDKRTFIGLLMSTMYSQPIKVMGSKLSHPYAIVEGLSLNYSKWNEADWNDVPVWVQRAAKACILNKEDKFSYKNGANEDVYIYCVKSGDLRVALASLASKVVHLVIPRFGF